MMDHWFYTIGFTFCTGWDGECLLLCHSFSQVKWSSSMSIWYWHIWIILLQLVEYRVCLILSLKSTLCVKCNTERCAKTSIFVVSDFIWVSNSSYAPLSQILWMPQLEQISYSKVKLGLWNTEMMLTWANMGDWKPTTGSVYINKLKSCVPIQGLQSWNNAALNRHAFVSRNGWAKIAVKWDGLVYDAFFVLFTNRSLPHDTPLLSPSNHDTALNLCACKKEPEIFSFLIFIFRNVSSNRRCIFRYVH